MQARRGGAVRAARSQLQLPLVCSEGYLSTLYSTYSGSPQECRGEQAGAQGARLTPLCTVRFSVNHSVLARAG